MSDTTPSTSSSVVSMWIASSAGSMRDASLSSRSRRSVASASAPMSGPLGLAAPCANALVGGEVDLHVGARSDDRADVAALHHGVGLVRRARAGARASLRAPPGAARRRAPRGRSRVSRIAAVTSSPAIATCPAVSSSTGCSACELAEAARRPRARSLAQREPRHRPVHRARVEVADAQPLRKAACDRALAGPCGPVDGDDHRLASDVEKLVEAGERYRRRLRAPYAYALSRDDAGDRADDGDAVVARSLDLAASRPCGHAAYREAVGCRPHARADRAQGASPPCRCDPTPSRAAPLRPRTRLVPRAIDAASANSGSSSIMPRDFGRDDLRRHELGMRDLEIGHRLARLRPPVENGDARAHPLERVEQARFAKDSRRHPGG